LLFPSPVQDGRMVGELRKQLDAVAEGAGWKPGEIRTKAFRHTYCAARLQTLDGGAPISAFTVAREMGHGGMALVNRVYGHLGTVRHRGEHVEFRTAIIRRIADVRVRSHFNRRLRIVAAQGSVPTAAPLPHAGHEDSGSRVAGITENVMES
jgi:hypothetical protein